MQEFFKDGKLHRNGGPAVIRAGVREWFTDGGLLRTEYENTADVAIGALAYFGRNNLARVTSGHDDDGNHVPLIEGLNYIVDLPARTFMLKSMPDAPVPWPLVIVTEQIGDRDFTRELAEAKALRLRLCAAARSIVPASNRGWSNIRNCAGSGTRGPRRMI